MPWKVRIEIRGTASTLFPLPLPDATVIEVTGATKLGTLAQAVTMALAGARAGMGELLAALRELRQVQAAPSQPSEPAAAP